MLVLFTVSLSVHAPTCMQPVAITPLVFLLSKFLSIDFFTTLIIFALS